MELTIESRSPCIVCGYRVRTFRFMGAVVNRRSIRSKGSHLVASMGCPECHTPAYPLDREPAVLLPDSAVAVAAYRARKWPVEVGQGGDK